MAHFAEINLNNIVIRVIAAEQDVIDSGIVGDSANWVQTSYNTRQGIHYAPNSGTPDDGVPLRKNFAGKGFTYDKIRDAFIPPRPYESWALNEDTCDWESPIACPEDGKPYRWNEETTNWVEG